MRINVAFVVLNFKLFQDTIRVTKEILNFGQEDFCVIIVDNASPNESYKILCNEFKGASQVVVLKNSQNNGYAKGNNVGLKYLKCVNPEYVCIINNDVHFSVDTIQRLCSLYKQLPSPGAISPIQLLPNGKIAPVYTLDIPTLLYDIKTYSLLFHPTIHKYVQNTPINNVQKVGIIPGAFIFINFNTFASLGFFDEDTFLFCEERFLGKKVEDNNLINYIILDEKYIHEHSKTINKESSKRMQREYLYDGKIKFWRKYSSFPIFAIIVLRFAYCIYRIELKVLSLLKVITRWKK